MENALFRVIIRTTVPQKGKGTQWLMNCTMQTIIDFTALKGKKKKPMEMGDSDGAKRKKKRKLSSNKPLANTSRPPMIIKSRTNVILTLQKE